MNARVQRLVERLQERPEEAFFLERMELLEAARASLAETPAARRYARAFAHLLDGMTVEIEPDELIVGIAREVIPDPDQERQFLALAESEDFSAAELFSFDPLGLAEIREIRPRYAPGWFHAWGHLTPDWKKLLAIGVLGVVDEARAALEALPEGAESADRRAFYEDVVIVGTALDAFARRYAARARTLASQETDARRREELLDIASRCERVPGRGARDFAEALQSVWFLYLVLHCACGARDYGLGRFDHYLAPYQEAAFDGDRLEWLQCFFVKLNEIIGREVESHTPKRILSVNSLHYLILGGRDRDGEPGSGEIALLALKAVGGLGLKQPTVVVRWYDGLDPALLDQACRLAREGLGNMSFFNDEAVIPALESAGVPEDEAVDYVHYGCNNINLPGLEDELREAWINLPKLLELAVDGGRCQLTGRVLGPETPRASALRTFDDLLGAFRLQVRAAIDSAARRIARSDETWAALRPFSFESLWVSDCMRRGVDLTAGGCRWRHMNVHAVGLATAANALAALRRLVFAEREMSLPELRSVLEKDFAGCEPLRRRLADRFPKFGNDDFEVDEIARAVGQLFVDETFSVAPEASGRRALWPSFYSLWHHREFGRRTGASADGRQAGAPLSESQSPVYDTERLGPTAALASVAKLPLNRTPTGGLNVKLQPSYLRGDAGVDRLRGIVVGYFRQGGMQLQLNLLDRATLLDARAHPERHRNLLVRVVGYSAYFVTLSPEQQDEIIARTEYGPSA